MSNEGLSDKPVLKGFPSRVKLYLQGMCMGAADIVPGISGGTVAFILGFYEDLLHSINTFNGRAFAKLFKGKFTSFFDQVAWQFLGTLLLGISTSFILFASLFQGVLNHPEQRVYLYATFLGLILGSTIFCAKQVRNWSWTRFLGLTAGIVIAFFLTSYPPSLPNSEPVYHVQFPVEKFSSKTAQSSIANYDSQNELLLNIPESTLAAMFAKNIISSEDQVVEKSTNRSGNVSNYVEKKHRPLIDPWLVFCGSIAITALLLPGISGSYMLTILGVYPIIIGALADVIHATSKLTFDTEAFFILFSLLIGIIIGAVIFSRIVGWLLKHYHDVTVATLTGFMVGALESVWPFWSYQWILFPLKPEKGPQLEVISPLLPNFYSSTFAIALGWMILGIAIVLVFEFVALKGKKPHKSN